MCPLSANHKTHACRCRLCVFGVWLCSLHIGFTKVPKNIEGLGIPVLNRLFVVVQSPWQILGQEQNLPYPASTVSAGLHP